MDNKDTKKVGKKATRKPRPDNYLAQAKQEIKENAAPTPYVKPLKSKQVKEAPKEGYKAPVGRQKTLDYEELVEEFNKYVDITDYPIIKEFCVLYNISFVHLDELKREIPDLAYVIKRSLAKSEMWLEKNALVNKCNPIFAMFRLKQPCFGWTDKQDISIGVEPKKLTQEEVQRLLKEKKDNEQKCIEASYTDSSDE